MKMSRSERWQAALREAAQLVESTADAYESDEQDSDSERVQIVPDLRAIANQLWHRASVLSAKQSKRETRR